MCAVKRPDGRENTQLRKFKLTPDFLSHPIASVLVEAGGTRVICSVSFESGVPGWMRSQGVSGGWLTAEYGLLPASTHTRSQREVSKGKASGRTLEIQRLIGRSLRSVVDLELLGPNTIYIDCDVIDADGGTRCASICGAAAALQLAFRRLMAKKVIARNPMRENVAAVSVGIRNGVHLLDLCYEEDSSADVDFNVVMTESGKFVEVQGTAEEEPFSREDLDKLLALASDGLKKIFEAQNKIIELEPVPKPDPKTFGSLGDALAAAKPL
ncbi:MAG: ribonuclease PH [Lentisphaeria bacterium]|nr:ribonuclease PH [Lentisphaeria bacterium]